MGTATETICSPCSLILTTVAGLPVSALITSGKAEPLPPGIGRVFPVLRGGSQTSRPTSLVADANSSA